MNDAAKWYPQMIEDISEIADVFLDFEGGDIFLVVLYEVLQELLEHKQFLALVVIIKELYAVAQILLPCNIEDSDYSILFVQAIRDLLQMDPLEEC